MTMKEKKDNGFITSISNNRKSTKKSNSSISTTTPITVSSRSKSTSVLIVMGEDCQGWYDIGQQITGRNDTTISLSASGGGGGEGVGGGTTSNGTDGTQASLTSWRQAADDLYAQEVYNFTNARKEQSTADDRWIEGTMSKGTMKDKIAAMSIVIGNHPFHKLSTLDALLNLASSSMKGTTTSTASTTTTNQQARIRPMAIEALTDLFLHTLLPPHRNLIPLTQRPLHLYADTTSTGITTSNHTTTTKTKNTSKGKKTLSPKVLLLWRYEELLKQRYLTFLRKVLNQEMLLLQSSSTSEQLMEGQKIIALRTVITLLKERSECEGELLSMAVNKIGDPNRKVASSASYLLHSQLLTQHPAMTMVVAKEVQNLAFRPHLSSRALYNCIIFLNQLRFTDNTTTNTTNTLPQQLVQTYFKLFEIAILCSTSTITTTIQPNHNNNNNNKILRKSSYKKHNRKKNHKKNRKTSSSSSLSTSSTMEKIQSRLLCALLTGVNRARPFLPKSDQKMDQYVDSIYRVAHQAPPSASTQALLLLFHLTVDDASSTTTTTTRTTTSTTTATTTNKQQQQQQQQQQQDRLYRVIYSKLSDPAMYTGKHVTMFLNLIYKSMKHDTKDTRIVAFAKRLLQTTMTQSSGVGIVAGTIFLLSEVIKYKPILQYCIETNIPNTTWDNTAREPTYAVKKEHKKNSNNNNEDDDDNNHHHTVETDGCSIWELSMLLFHFHPSVVKFSETIGSITYDGDPTRNFTLSSFLDRFAYRQPKKANKEQLTVEDKRLFVQGPRRRRLLTNTTGTNTGVVPLNDPSLLQQKPTNIAEEDKFFYRYFEERARRDDKKGIMARKKLSTDEEDDDDQFEAIHAREKSNLDSDSDMDSDPEEEAFVTQLAEKLINQHEGGRINFDDEDPDMEDWDDESDQGDNEDDMASSTGSADSIENYEIFQDTDGDCMLEIGSSDEDKREGEEEEEEFLMDTEDDDDNLWGERKKKLNLDKKEKGDEKKKKVNRRPEAFVDADDYEELISKSWAERDALIKGDTKEVVTGVKERSTKKRKYQDPAGQRKKT